MDTFTTSDKQSFEKHGFVQLASPLSSDEVQLLASELSRVERTPLHVSFERNRTTPRAYHGCHLSNPVFSALPCLPQLLIPVMALLEGSVYLYQFKINLKSAFDGDAWPWHRDYSFWKHEDEMPAPLALTAAIYLDDVTEFNGPMFVIPGSHKADVESTAAEEADPANWEKNFSSDLAHRATRDEVATLAARHGLVANIAPKGSIVLFHCNLLHGSPGNMSPMSRRVVLLTYNRVDNVPLKVARPHFLVHPPTPALCPLSVSSLTLL